MVIAHWEAKGPALLEEGVHVSFHLRRDSRKHGLSCSPSAPIIVGAPAAMARTNRSVDGHSTSVVRRWTRTSRNPASSINLRSWSPSPSANRGNALRSGPTRRPRAARSPHRVGCPPRSASTRSRVVRQTGGPVASREGPGADPRRTGDLADRGRDQRRPRRTAAPEPPPRAMPRSDGSPHYARRPAWPCQYRGRLPVPWGPRARHQTRDSAGSAGHVQGPIADAWRLEVKEIRGPHQAEALNGMALVDFGGGPAQVAHHSLIATVHVHLREPMGPRSSPYRSRCRNRA